MPSYKDETTGKWYCSFYYTNLQGKRVRKLKRGFLLKREADKWERDFLTTEHAEEISMNVLVEEFKMHLQNECAKGNIKRSTLDTNTKYIEYYISPYFKNVIASRLAPKHIDEWLVKITQINQKPLSDNSRYYIDHPEKTRKTRRSSNTINAARALLSRIFQYGRKNYGLSYNPVLETERVKDFSNDQRAKLWTIEEYITFRNSLEREDMKVLFDTIYFSGLRIGEALALTPNDISPTHIHVDRGLIKVGSKVKYIDTPKTKNSKRDVNIPNFLYEELLDFIQRNKYLECNNFVFNIEEETARNHLDVKAHKLGLPIISPHILRHSYATNIINSTKDYVAAAALLGHSNPSTTLRFYAHREEKNKQAAIAILEEMNPNKQK